MACEDGNGERAGARTRDHLIKSQVLYQLSYALVKLSFNSNMENEREMTRGSSWRAASAVLEPAAI